MEKKLLSLFLALMLIVGIFPTNVIAQSEAPERVPLVLNNGDVKDNIFIRVSGRTERSWKDEDYIEFKEMSKNDSRLLEFKEEHQDLFYERHGSEQVCHGYEIKVKNYFANSFGVINIEVLEDNLDFQYDIWPEQIEAYMTVVAQKSDGTDETLEKNERKVVDVVPVAGNAPYGNHSYGINIDCSKTFDDGGKEDTIKEGIYEIYIFQGKPKNIPDNLLPGTYEVPVIARNASGSGRYSMSKAAISEKGILRVGQKGEKDLTIKFKPMGAPEEIAGNYDIGLTGHLLKLWEYNSLEDYNNYIEKPGLYEKVRKELHPSDYYLDLDSGIEYPQSFIIPLRNNEAEKMVAVIVDAMGLDNPQDLSLLMDMNGLKQISYNFPSGKYRAGIDEHDDSKTIGILKQIAGKCRKLNILVVLKILKSVRFRLLFVRMHHFFLGWI
ncbi:hypothetical protein [Anaerosphaera multitolerans]|uniref:Uncharacterized protein n=1 Tax=Anaerosphaera multitolerans TaxID=2487351 RepID=A0A437S609_9FIRM|nr:hypothetical protein [Anaerosphaera multitolerans]RVU54418.1 hypothetical protein EF514_07435 [Anaerosphaera multitolerans]